MGKVCSLRKSGLFDTIRSYSVWMYRRSGSWSEARSSKKKSSATEVDRIETEIVRRALEEPLRMIAQNAGAEGSIVLAKVRESKDKNFGYNAQTDVYENLVTSGVIDPTKVTRTALQNAASIAGLLLTTECVVVERKEEKPAPAGGPPGGGMGGMY